MGKINNYFDSFEHVRSPQGEAVSRLEILRRLAHYLQVPQKFGYRLMLAFEAVLYDALLHGEGLKIKGLGTITLERHKSDTYKGFGEVRQRKVLYKYKFKPSEEALRFLDHISDLERKGELDDFFSNPKD